MLKTASLTGALLVAKGAAAPIGQPSRAAPTGMAQRLPRPARRRDGGAKPDGEARLSLRMSAARHLRLRVAAARLGESGQAVMLAAIDHYLDRVVPQLLEGACLCLEQGRASGGSCPAAAFADRTP